MFVVSDTHFSHRNILAFTDKAGNPIRPQFSSLEEMDETIVDNWNRVVKPTNIVYHLGDFSFGGKQNIAKFASRLNGKKRLILGNHDYNAKDYVEHFEEVMSFYQTKKHSVPVVMCHFPLHLSSFQYRVGDRGINLHGHIHEKTLDDPRWVNVCVEHTNFTPIHIEDVLKGK